MEHIRIDPKFRRRPRTKRSGFKARETFLFLLQVSAEFDLHGRIPPSMWEMPWMVDEWTNGDNSCAKLAEEILCDGIEAGLREGLLAVDGGVLVIVDWDDFYKPAKTNAERQANHRSRVTKVTEPVTCNASNESNATIQHSTSLNTTPLNVTKEEEPPPPIEAMGATVLPPEALCELADRRALESPLRAPPDATFALEKPEKPPDTWEGDDFWRWVQWRRQESGYVPERQRPHPRKLSAWWSATLGTAGVTVQALKLAFGSFGADPYWETKKPPYPFNAFMSGWDKYVRLEARHAS